jgi:hypothetical protein
MSRIIMTSPAQEDVIWESYARVGCAPFAVLSASAQLELGSSRIPGLRSACLDPQYGQNRTMNRTPTPNTPRVKFPPGA